MQTFPILDKLGGLEAVFRKLQSRGFPINTKDAIRMWRSPARGVIPGHAVTALMQICEESGIKYTADDFMPVQLPDRPARADAEAA